MPTDIRSISKKSLGLITAAVLLLALGSVFFLDHALTSLVKTDDTHYLYQPIRKLTDLAEANIYFFAVAVIGIGSWIGKKLPAFQNSAARLQQAFQWSLYALACLLASGTALHLLKPLIGRQRPHLSPDFDARVFDFLTTNWHFHSLPSGHSQTAFTVGTVLWVTFPRMKNWIFLVAAALAFTRVPLKQHFFSDVLTGSLLGFLVTVWVSQKMKRLRLRD